MWREGNQLPRSWQGLAPCRQFKKIASVFARIYEVCVRFLCRISETLRLRVRACEAVLWHLFQIFRASSAGPESETLHPMSPPRIKAKRALDTGQNPKILRAVWLGMFVQAKTLTRSASHANSMPLPLAAGLGLTTRRELNAGLTSSSAHPDPAMGKTPDRLRIPNLGNWRDSSATMKRLIRENLQSQKANLSPPPVIPGSVTG